MNKLNNVALRAYVKTLAGDRKGVTAIEYGLIAGLIAVAIIVAVTAVGGNLTNLFTNISTKLAAA
ncbi:MAG: Flp family type IVb pilin [Alphaproteobacteria bacterium]|jgi:pilus assembly protein Flp/PilA|nr:Flp family type IVb pilin [Alphaproteobacteria bacterium]